MKGFGKRETPKTTNVSKKRDKLSPRELKDLGIKSHMRGHLEHASKYYESFIRTGVNDPDVIANYALICQENGETEKALKLYKKCIDQYPRHAYALTNLAHLYLEIGEPEAALTTAKNAIRVNPQLANAHSCLGVILKECGDLDAAESSTRKALQIDKDLSDAKLNLGLILNEKGMHDEAKKITVELIEIEPKNADAYLNLGAILQDKGLLNEAFKATNKALELNKDLKDVNMNLGSILYETGKFKEALCYVRKEISTNPENFSAYLLMHSILKEFDVSRINSSEARELIELLLERKDIGHHDLFSIADKIFRKETLENFLLVKEDGFNLNNLPSLINDEIFLKGLGLFQFHGFLWEEFLTKLRRVICFNLKNINNTNKNTLFRLTTSLAEQCFINEYIFNFTEKENGIIINIEDKIENDSINEFEIATLACYKPCYALIEKCKRLEDYKSRSTEFNNLLLLQIKEPLIEKELAKLIEKLGAVDEETSRKVQDQYENYPYPRWRYISDVTKHKLTIESAIKAETSPNLNINFPNKRQYKILIAGCGTGQQVLSAIRYKNANITAIDLSSSSLSYAKRKSIEYGVSNIRFIQMDINNLELLNEKFDLIECSGVLHHMKDPQLGLNKLVNSLATGGYIKLGLYSQLARRDIEKARSIIKKKGYGNSKDEVCRFRNDLKNKKHPEIYSINEWPDFYSTSMCIDLCFHIQEHRFTINQLRELLDNSGLSFSGFVLPRAIKDSYSINNKDDPFQLNLIYWSKFEKENPDIFRCMYQFWVTLKT